MILHTNNLRVVIRQNNVAAIEVRVHDRLHTCTTTIRRSIHMSTEANYRHFLIASSFDGSINVSVGIKFSIAYTHGIQFLDKQFPKIFLLFC